MKGVHVSAFCAALIVVVALVAYHLGGGGRSREHQSNASCVDDIGKLQRSFSSFNYNSCNDAFRDGTLDCDSYLGNVPAENVCPSICKNTCCGEQCRKDLYIKNGSNW